MDDQAVLSLEFEQLRSHLREVAHRMLGSLVEADDAVQEAWLRASKADRSGVRNPPGWLTTIVARVCLDMLRSRHRERGAAVDTADLDLADRSTASPEEEAVLADSVGLAMLVVLDRLGPAERVAYVLHDMFSIPFEQIGEIVERSPVTAKKIASRARSRMQGTSTMPTPDIVRQREVAHAFLAASRAGDMEALLGVLAPDVVRRATRSPCARACAPKCAAPAWSLRRRAATPSGPASRRSP